MNITKWTAFRAGLPVVITSSPVSCRAPVSRPCRPACSKSEPNGGLLAFARDIPGANKKALIARSAVLRSERDGSSCPSMAGSLISFALQVES